MKEVFAKRLRNARIMQCLSMDALCEKINNIITKQTIAKYEKGMILPSSTVLISLANALNIGIDYFFRPFSFSIGKIEFRKKSRLSKKDELSIKEFMRFKLERYIEILDILGVSNEFHNPLSIYSIKNEQDVITAVDFLKKEWQLGLDGISNLVEVIEEHNIIVLGVDKNKDFDGLSANTSMNIPVICFNQNMIPERQRFTILHELGHILLHFDDSVNSKQKEVYCHLFANEMLIAGVTFKGMVGEKRHDISVNELSDIQIQFGISIDALMHKAKDMNIISEQRYKFYNIKKNHSNTFKNLVEQSRIQQKSSNRFERLVYKALTFDLISISKASYYLDIPVEQIHRDLKLV